MTAVVAALSAKKARTRKEKFNLVVPRKARARIPIAY
jgi:hypothetical protein